MLRGLAAALIVAGLAPGSAHAATASACQRLGGFRHEAAHVTSARLQDRLIDADGPQKAQVPAYCRVVARVERADGGHITIEVWLPRNWNGRYLQAGNSGFAGSIAYPGLAAGLKQGFAVASSDGGHQSVGGDMAWAVGRPQRMADFGHLALRETARFARRIIRTYYQRSPRRAYFSGCSDGGREALMALQRYPEQFDGWLVGAPENDFTGELVDELVFTQRSRSAYASVTASQLARVSAALRGHCGGADGLVADPASCRVDLAALGCDRAGGADCLTSAQVAALADIRADWRGSGGQQPFLPGLAMTAGAESGPGQWATWLTGGPGGVQAGPGWHEAYAQPFFGTFLYGNPALDLSGLDPARAWRDAHDRISADVDAVDTDLSRQRSAGKKVIQYHGWADAGIPVQFSLAYYDAVRTRLGGDVRDFYRLFLVPGMGHCGGGPGDMFLGGAGQDPVSRKPDENLLQALVAWVERGRAPQQLVAGGKGRSGDGRAIAPTRRILPYDGRK